MRRYPFHLLLIITCLGCGQKHLTFEELTKAQWKQLSPGVYCISLSDKKGIATKSDSLDMEIKGVVEEGVDPIEMSLSKPAPATNKAISNILKKHLPDSKAGYLKINLFDMLRPAVYQMKIYLKDHASPYSFSTDSLTLTNMDGIAEIKFISKEEASKRYMDDGNDDWKKVLDVNPLPNSIEIDLDKTKEWTESSLNALKTAIENRLPFVSDVQYPGAIFQKSSRYYFFEYTWK